MTDTLGNTNANDRANSGEPGWGGATADGEANGERIRQFKADVADMKLRDPATGLDRLLGRLGVVCMLVGIGIGIYAWLLASDASGSLQQRDAIVQGVLGLTVTVTGAALYVKSALAGFLRFWMARLCYEQQAQTDRLLRG